MQTKKKWQHCSIIHLTWSRQNCQTQHPFKTFLGKLKRAISTLSKTLVKSFLTLLWHHQLHHTFETMEIVQGTCIHIDACATWKACRFHFGVGGWGLHPGTFYKLWTNRSQWAFGAAADIGQWPAFSTQGAVLMLSHPKEEANGLVLCMTRPLNSIQFFFVMTRYRLLEQSAYFLWCLLKLEATKCPCFLKA